MECIDTLYDHERTAGVDDTWFKPVEVNDLISQSKAQHLKKIRTIGYLRYSNGDCYIQNLDSVFGSTKCQILVLIDNLATIPQLSPPQPVQIFGEVCYPKAIFCGTVVDTHSDGIESKVSNNENTCRERTVGIKAKVIQYVLPSIIHQMNVIVLESSKR